MNFRWQTMAPERIGPVRSFVLFKSRLRSNKAQIKTQIKLTKGIFASLDFAMFFMLFEFFFVLISY
jgi:hypothetical protein